MFNFVFEMNKNGREVNINLENNAIEIKKTAKALLQLKKKNPKRLDETFERAHDVVFSKVDCLACANCCKTTSPIFRDVDVKRISKHLRMNAAAFEKQYLREDSDNDLVLKSSPCTFLDDSNYCTIYEVRPLACREYPHTNRKRMHQILKLTAKNLEICPAVNDIVNRVITEI